VGGQSRKTNSGGHDRQGGLAVTSASLAAPIAAEQPRSAATPRIAVVGCFAQHAANRRTSLIAKALQHAGAEASITMPGRQSSSNPFVRRARAVRNGIDELAGLVRTGVDAVFNYSESWLYSAPVWRLARRHGVRVVQDCVEWYEPICFHGNGFHPTFLDHRAKRERLAARADGVTVITSRLAELYFRRGASTFLLPPLCDSSEFDSFERRRTESFGVFEIVVVASGKPADGDDLLRPILETAYQRGARFNVTVIGSSDPFDGAPLRTPGHVEISRLSNLSRHDYLRTLAAAEVFLLPRRSGLHSEAAFPNRVPEFLASGGLLVTASVGDLPRYIRHGNTGLLSPEGDVDAFASALCWVADHRHEAADIGSNGRRAALERFDYRVHAQPLLQFVLGKRWAAR
jgi:glycosyltransferase involved in cell wall biosynthesis